MKKSSSSQPNTFSPKVAIARWVMRTILGTVVIAAILFITAGTTVWLMAWVYVVSLFIIGILSAMVLDPGLLAERMTRKHPDQKPWDKVLFPLYGALYGFVVPFVAALDIRLRWTPDNPQWILYLAIFMYVFGSSMDIWAMAENKFFAQAVRIQNDRGQVVVATGPYQFIRHPGYLGGVITCLAMPLLLESAWAFIPGFLAGALLVVRTALEDKVLLAELPGYARYARNVRYRLLPGIW